MTRLSEVCAIAFRVICVLFCLFSIYAAWHVPAAGGGIFLAGAAGMIPSIIPAQQRNRRFRWLKNFTPTVTPSQIQDTLPRDFVYEYLKLRLTCQVDVAAGGGADGVLAPEQPWSLIRQLKLVASSSSRTKIAELVNCDLAGFQVLQGFLQHQLPTAVGLAIPGIQAATQISAEVELPFYFTRSANPRYGALNTHELNSLDLFLDWGGGATDLNIGGTRAWTLTNPMIQVHGAEFLDDPSNRARYSVRQVRVLDFTGVTANTNMEVKIEGSNIFRGIMVKQFTRAAGVIPHTPVNTIINGLRLELNGTPKIEYRSNGLAGSGFALLQSDNWDLYSATAIPVGYGWIDLMRTGQFDELIRESDYTTIRLMLDVNTVVNGCVRVFVVEEIDAPQ